MQTLISWEYYNCLRCRFVVLFPAKTYATSFPVLKVYDFFHYEMLGEMSKQKIVIKHDVSKMLDRDKMGAM